MKIKFRKNRLKEALYEAHMTQRELALRAGLTESAISRYVNGTRPISMEKAFVLARCLGIEIAELIDGKRPDIEIIVAVAMKTKEGRVFVSRHSHSELIVMYPKEFKYAEQGFLTSKNRFVDRNEAFKIADYRNQIVQKHGLKDELYSEDIFLNEKR